jgi:hypothetical protein
MMPRPKLSDVTKDEIADRMTGEFVKWMKGDGNYGHAWTGLSEGDRDKLAARIRRKIAPVVDDLEGIVAGDVKEWHDLQD